MRLKMSNRLRCFFIFGAALPRLLALAQRQGGRLNHLSDRRRQAVFKGQNVWSQSVLIQRRVVAKSATFFRKCANGMWKTWIIPCLVERPLDHFRVPIL